MQQLTAAANQAVQELSQRYGVSTDAVRTLLFAVAAGGGTMAQFHHPELGGGGQWMQGGMTMVGDMFNHGLKATVSGLCSELSSLLASRPLFVPAAAHSGQGHGLGSQGNAWWPAEFGSPAASGGQGDARYAYFPQARRLLIERAGKLSIYDALDHNIGGVQQQQGGPWGSLSFTSQYGTFTVDSLPLVDDGNQAAPQPQSPAPPHPPSQPAQPQVQPASASQAQRPAPAGSATSGSGTQPQSQEAILSAIERLGDLHQRGMLSDDEFRVKKSELLARL